MGRQVDLEYAVRSYTNKLRRILYFLETKNFDAITSDRILKFFCSEHLNCVTDILLMELQDAIPLEQWGVVRLRDIARSLEINGWTSMTKDELILQIKNHITKEDLYGSFRTTSLETP